MRWRRHYASFTVLCKLPDCAKAWGALRLPWFPGGNAAMKDGWWRGSLLYRRPKGRRVVRLPDSQYGVLVVCICRLGRQANLSLHGAACVATSVQQGRRGVLKHCPGKAAMHIHGRRGDLMRRLFPLNTTRVPPAALHDKAQASGLRRGSARPTATPCLSSVGAALRLVSSPVEFV